MVLYSCPRCGYSNKIKTKIKAHFMRKNVCSAICSDKSIEECYEEVLGEKYPNISKNPQISSSVSSKSTPEVTQNIPNNPQLSSLVSSNNNTCKYCDKILSSYKNKWRHEKNCREKEMFTKDEVIALLADSKNKDKLINELQKQIEVLLTKVGNTTNNTNNNTQNNYIIINAFGKENMDYITDNYVKKLLDKENGYNFIPKLLKDIHFNPEHKENMNICIPNKKQSLAKIYNGDKWILEEKKGTIEKMTDNAYKTLIDNYDENNNKQWKKIVEGDLYPDDEETTNNIQKSTELMVLNSQDEVLKNVR